jgi:predicted XRE-type DNA-binding protein
MTPEMAAMAKFLVEKRGLLQHEAAAILGVNQGRISEVMTGKRFGGINPPDQLPLGF